MSVLDAFAPLFTPRSVAVLGASPGGGGLGNAFIRRLRAFGYDGAIWPVHPSAAEVEGLPAFRSLGETPGVVDYAIVAIGAERVPDAIAAARGRVRFAQVMSSGFAEVEGGAALQDRLLAAAAAAGVRILGPNCLGTHSPRGGLTFFDGVDPTPGSIGILSQSGGLSLDILRRGRVRGLGLSALVTMGNCADLGTADLLDYLLADPATRVIGLYLEDARDARRIFDLLRATRGAKPVVLLKGGQTREGQRAAASHTGSLASDHRLWMAMARQAGVAMTDTLDGFLDALLAFQLLAPRADSPLRRVALFGNGGGTSVLATDAFVRHGFDVPPFGGEAQAALGRLKVPPGSSLANPIDVPGNALRLEEGRVAEGILRAVYAHAAPDAVVMHLNMPVLLGYAEVDLLGSLMASALRVRAEHRGGGHFVLVLRSDGDAATEELRRTYRTRALAAGIPVFDELPAAAAALAALRAHEAFLAREALARDAPD
ncbi:CoA-binding protein [Falsiroseomonas sp. CW058]|uniref:CoA-binding protein n=1 Tax=Falsiroseomonas sp. CW058 TaxID=3388664 RepID=UPI003D324643